MEKVSKNGKGYWLRPWDTRHEIKYLETIGTHAKGFKDISRRSLLIGYLEGARSRANWDGIDKIVVVARAIDLLVSMGESLAVLLRGFEGVRAEWPEIFEGRSGVTLSQYGFLSPRSREALILRGTGLSVREVATIMGITEGGAAALLHQARKQIDANRLAA